MAAKISQVPRESRVKVWPKVKATTSLGPCWVGFNSFSNVLRLLHKHKQQMELERVGEKALVSLNDDHLFKKPKMRKKKVLDEDTYTEKVEKIIVRDFYPDLSQLNAQSEYLHALETNDLEKLREIHIKYGPKRPGQKTPNLYSTPATFETPENEAKGTPGPLAGESSKTSTSSETCTHNPEPKDVKDVGRGLDSFMEQNISEDDASFAEMMKVNEERHKQKHAWLHEQEEEQLKRADNAVALPSLQKQAIEDGNQTRVETWKYSSKNFLMYVPEGAPESAAESIQRVKAKPREILHKNTRFSTSPFDSYKSQQTIHQVAAVQAQNRQGKIGPDGKEILPAQSPKVNGYGFVATPSPAPGVDESPLMTWGEIEGTPFRLDGSDTPIHNSSGPVFKMPNVPKRDQLLHNLNEEVGRAYRTKKQEALKRVRRLASPLMKTGSKSRTERFSSMSPAAQRLASSKLGIRTNTDRALRASYTPSPGRGTPSDKTPLITTPTPSPSRTPQGTATIPKSGATPKRPEVSSLTDNLLNLPKRPQAADFF